MYTHFIRTALFLTTLAATGCELTPQIGPSRDTQMQAIDQQKQPGLQLHEQAAYALEKDLIGSYIQQDDFFTNQEAFSNFSGDLLAAATADNLLPDSGVGAIEFGSLIGSFGGLTEKAKRGEIRIRLLGPTGYDRELWKGYTVDALSTWLDALRILPSSGVITNNIVFVDRGEDQTIIVHPNTGRAYWRPKVFPWESPTIHLYEHSNDERTVLHEFGHALGLADMYVEGVWNCQDGQYDKSIMCSQFEVIAAGGELRLTADDIRGVRYEFCSRHSDCQARDYEDYFGGRAGRVETAQCPAGTEMVGANIRSGGLLDSITPLCADSLANSLPFAVDKLGGEGGNARSFRCPANSFVSDMRIRAGGYVDSVQLRCSDGSVSPRFGGGGGSSDRWYGCPAGFRKVTGVRGREGRYVDAIGLTCEEELL